MGKSRKKLKCVDAESQHMAEEESYFDCGMGFPSKRMEQQLPNEDGSASEDQSHSEDELNLKWQKDEDAVKGHALKSQKLPVDPEKTNVLGFGETIELLMDLQVHCISSWGHDFRPSYPKLSSLRIHLPGVPILALTATAVPQVEKDVIGSLCLRQPLVLRASFSRPNIFYEDNIRCSI